MALVDKVIMGAVGLFVIASLIPSAISTITAVNTSGWGTTEITLWGLMPVMVVVGLILAILYLFKGRK